jgi:hypothetical protein
MDPKKWGTYGWKMIHTYSRLNVDLGEYTRWLQATSKILPCRKCRQNFKKHIRSQICKPAKSPEYLSICLHNAVSSTIGKDMPSAHEYTIQDLPELTRENLFQPEFWSTMYLNTTIGKNKVLCEWVKQTERILRKGNRTEEADRILDLIYGKYGEFPPTKKQDLARRRQLRTTIQRFLKNVSVRVLTPSQEYSRLGKSVRPRATRKRARISLRKDPSGRTRRVSRNLQ